MAEKAEEQKGSEEEERVEGEDVRERRVPLTSVGVSPSMRRPTQTRIP